MVDFTTEKLIVPIDEVIPNPFNDNYQDKFTFERQKKSMETFGMLGTIITRSYAGHYQILGGEHRWKSLKELGNTTVPIENIITSLTDSEAKSLIMLLNMQGKKDIIKTAQMLEEMEEGQLELLPMTADEIENTKKFVSFDFSQYDVEAEARERKFGKVVVLQLTSEEGVIWEEAKKLLIERSKIDPDNTKKRQDVQTMMYLLENFLNVSLGGSSNERIRVIKA